MAWFALGLFVLYAVLGFGWRAWVQQRRTGDAGFRGFHGRRGSAEWWAGALFVLGAALVPAGPVADLAGMRPVAALDQPWIAWGGAVTAGLGIVGTLWTQLALGASWRVGVDDSERTELVTDGPFGLARNPIFTMMVITVVGLALMVPNPVSLLAVVVFTVAIHLQVRVVEEPYLRRSHGLDYAVYAAQVGRFVPGLGRIPPTDARG